MEISQSIASDPEIVNTLTNIPALRSLSVHRVSERCLVQLSELRNVERLLVWYSPQITDQVIPWIAKMPKLKELRLSESNVSEASFDAFAQMDGLEALSLPASIPSSAIERLRERMPGCAIANAAEE